MQLQCPKGHLSSDTDYCSECGARMQGGQSAITGAVAIRPENLATAPGGAVCPVCGTPGAIGARYCEVCRYDFETAPPADTGAPAGVAPQSAIAPEAAVKPVTQPARPAPVPQPEQVPQRWDAVIAVDPSLNKIPDPAQPCPAAAPDRIFPLDLDENLAGRRSDLKDIHPEIVIADPGISRRHLTFRRRDDGGFIVIELGSTNGTVLNGVSLEPGIPVPLKDGDQLELGCWTRITVRAR